MCHICVFSSIKYRKNSLVKKLIQKRIKSAAFFLTAIFLICAIFFSFSSSLTYAKNNSDSAQGQQEDLGLYAKSAVLMDGNTGRILYGKNENEFMPNASTTKILTCILAIENGDPEQICTASEYACSMPQTKCGFSQGEQFYLKDLMYSLMLESHNDSAVVIAESIGGSVEKFADMMNAKAVEIGCENSNFITPNGLDATEGSSSHGTTASDLAKIMNYCRKNETFLEITRTKNYSFSDIEKKHTYQLSNTNSFLDMESGALTGKTGYTSKAGYCYVCAYQKDGRTYTIALLACGWPNHKSYKWSDSKKLIAYGNDNYEEKDVIIENPNNSLVSLSVTGGISLKNGSYLYPDQIKVQKEDKELICLLSANDKVTVTYDGAEKLSAPLKKGFQAGTENYYINGTYIGSRKVFLAENISAFNMGWCIRQFLKEFLQKAEI